MMQDIKIIFMMILEDCIKFLNDYFYAGLLTGGLSAFLYFVISVFRDFFIEKNFKDHAIIKWWKLPFIALMGFYCYLVSGITILSREKGAKYILSLTPFSTWGTSSWHLTLWIENILMLVPFGILLYILWRPFRKIGWSMLAGFLFSLVIECMQLFARLGKFEIDDMMNNIFGMLIAFLFCKEIDRLFLHVL